MWSPSSRTYAMGECVGAYVLNLRFKRVLFSCYCFNLNLINYCTSLKCSMNAVLCNSFLTFAISYRAQRGSRPIIVRVQSEQGNTLVLPYLLRNVTT